MLYFQLLYLYILLINGLPLKTTIQFHLTNIYNQIYTCSCSGVLKIDVELCFSNGKLNKKCHQLTKLCYCKKFRLFKRTCYNFNINGKDFAKLQENYIGKGAFGEVYKARDSHTGELVAVKVLKEDATISEKEEFANEATILSMLDQKVEFDLNQKTLVMRWVPGKPLLNRMEEICKRDYVEVLNEFYEGPNGVLAEIRALHKKNIVHRDPHPGNIMIDETTGKYSLIDFGFSKSRAQLGAEEDLAWTEETIDDEYLALFKFTEWYDEFRAMAGLEKRTIGREISEFMIHDFIEWYSEIPHRSTPKPPNPLFDLNWKRSIIPEVSAPKSTGSSGWDLILKWGNYGNEYPPLPPGFNVTADNNENIQLANNISKYVHSKSTP